MKTNEQEVKDYYNTRESKRGYMLLLKGTKHFGYYEKGDKPWQFQKAMRQMENRLGKELALPQRSKVLDAGCGMGDVASYLANHFKLNIEGIDILDFNIDEAKKRVKQRGLSKKVHVQEMSYADLKFKPNSFDGIYTMETLVHAVDPKRVLQEFYRVVKPGGKIVMFEYSHDPYRRMGKRAVKEYKTLNKLSAMPAFEIFNHGVQKRMMESIGFVDIHVGDITKNMLPMLKVFAYTGYIPYAIAAILGQRNKLINARAGIALWQYRKSFRYNIYSAKKP